MININKLSATVLLIKSVLFPLRQSDLLLSPSEKGVTTSISPAQFAAALAGISRLLRADGTLELHFEGALFPAAPFLLYRLKSAGFSDCKAIVTPQGILLTAIR